MANLSGYTIADSTTLAKYVPIFNKQIWDQVNVEENTWNKFSEDKESKRIGENYQVLLRTGYAWRGYGTRAQDAATMPTAAAPEYVKTTVNITRHFYSFQVDLESQEKSKDGGSIGPDAIADAMKNGAKVGAWNLNQQVFGDKTGKLAELYAATTAAAQPVKKIPGIVWIKNGMYLDGYDGTNKEIDSIKVSSTSVGTDNDTITFASSQASTIDAAAGFFFYLEDTYHATGYAMNGLKNMSSESSTLHGVDVATYPDWKGQTFDNSGTLRAFNVMHLRRIFSEMRRTMPDGCAINQMISNYGQLDNYYEVVAGQQEFDGAKMKADYGITELTWEGCDWLIDPYCEYNRIYILDKSKVQKIILRPLKVDDRDGNMFRLNTASDSVWGRLTGYMEMVCKVRKAVGVYSDLSEPELP